MQKIVRVSIDEAFDPNLNDSLHEPLYRQLKYSEFAHFCSRKVIASICLAGDNLKLFQQATKLFQETHEYPLSLEDQLNNVFADLIKDGKYFVRLEKTSPKDSYFGISPLFNHKQIATAIVSSYRCYADLLNTEYDKLWIFEWNDAWLDGIEFRVFIFERKITAISQYDIFAIDMNDDQLYNLSNKIIQVIQPVIAEFTEESFIIDVIYLPRSDEFEIIEINEFGASACLFSWQLDKDVLMGKQAPEFRITI